MVDLRVLHVIPAVAPRYGGPSRAIFEMCRALKQQGVDVMIATTAADGSTALPVTTGEPISYQGVQTIFFPRRWSQRFGYSPGLARWLNANAADFDALHIHAVFSHPCVAASRACRKHSVPYIVRPLGSLDPWSMKQKAFLKRFMWRMAIGRMIGEAAAIHYTTPDEQWLAEGSLKLNRGIVIPLGIELEKFHDRANSDLFLRKHPSLRGKPYVLALNRLHPKKNLGLLIKSFALLAKEPQFAAWRLVIAGDGESDYVDRLKRLAQERGGGEKVIFAGWLDGAERISALQNTELLALISHQENFGLAAVESLACGAPVLVSDEVNLAPKIKESGAGWTTSLNEAELSRSLAEAMMDTGERERRGRAGPEFVAANFAWPKVAADLITLYNSVAVRGKKAAQLHKQGAWGKA